MTRWAARTLKILAGLVLGLALLVGGALIATQTAWFRDWARGLGERQAARLLNGQLSIGRLDGNLWSGATLTDVRITQDGREVVRVERVRVTYRVRQLLSRQWRFPEITLTRPSIVLIHDAAGWHIANLLRPRRNDSPNAQPVELPSLLVEQGTVPDRRRDGHAGRPPLARKSRTPRRRLRPHAVARSHGSRDPSCDLRRRAAGTARSGAVRPLDGA
jgi:uncharacterized protein involved in outer membrane biogenesis